MLSEWNSPPAPSDLPHPTTHQLQVQLTLHLCGGCFPHLKSPSLHVLPSGPNSKPNDSRSQFKIPFNRMCCSLVCFPSTLLPLLFWVSYAIAGYALLSSFCQMVSSWRARPSAITVPPAHMLPGLYWVPCKYPFVGWMNEWLDTQMRSAVHGVICGSNLTWPAEGERHEQ